MIVMPLGALHPEPGSERFEYSQRRRPAFQVAAQDVARQAAQLQSLGAAGRVERSCLQQRTSAAGMCVPTRTLPGGRGSEEGIAGWVVLTLCE